jgi:hypothetical protein
MDTIRDMLSVGQERDGSWAIYRWDGPIAPCAVATFPREDEAFGVAVLICENVEKHGHDIDRAICAAMREYHEAVAHSAACALDNEPDAAELGRMAHAHAVNELPSWLSFGQIDRLYSN